MEGEVLAIKEKYKIIKTSVKIDGERSKEFDVKVEVYQGSVLNLLFAVMKDKVAMEARESVMKELLYADDLVLLRDS